MIPDLSGLDIVAAVGDGVLVVVSHCEFNEFIAYGRFRIALRAVIDFSKLCQ